MPPSVTPFGDHWADRLRRGRLCRDIRRWRTQHRTPQAAPTLPRTMKPSPQAGLRLAPRHVRFPPVRRVLAPQATWQARRLAAGFGSRSVGQWSEVCIPLTGRRGAEEAQIRRALEDGARGGNGCSIEARQPLLLTPVHAADLRSHVKLCKTNGESPQPDVPRKTLPDGASHAPHTKLSGRLRRRTALITTCRHPQRVITEVGNQVQRATERFDVTCDDIESGALAVLDLGHASDAHTHTGSHIPLGQPVLLARLSELMTTGFRQQST